MKYSLRDLIYIVRQFGLDPIRMAYGLKMSPRFMKDLMSFKRHGGRVDLILPALHDLHDNGGTAKGHYFWQDLICAQWVAADNPVDHFDIGSRLDGFIAHVASFREVLQLDIRPNKVTIPNVKFLQGDAQDNLREFANSFDSVSCLHSVEHFGLGRYGDTLQIDGHKIGMINIASCVKRGGYLYLSFPIGESSVQFNSQRVIDPKLPIELLSNFELLDFVLIPWVNPPVYGTHPLDTDLKIKGNAGLYKFRRIN